MWKKCIHKIHTCIYLPHVKRVCDVYMCGREEHKNSITITRLRERIPRRQECIRAYNVEHSHWKINKAEKNYNMSVYFRLYLTATTGIFSGILNRLREFCVSHILQHSGIYWYFSIARRDISLWIMTRSFRRKCDTRVCDSSYFSFVFVLFKYIKRLLSRWEDVFFLDIIEKCGRQVYPHRTILIHPIGITCRAITRVR